jgi:predicted ribosome quality control (RQC) complex YloA/Tae2 family protein
VASKGKPYRTLRVAGFEILVGRGSEENDDLTFNVAEPHDVWMHVGGGTPGSHVVIRNPSHGEVPKDVIVAAAEITAWYSKARGAAKVEVCYCPASAVSKPRGAPAGLVELAREKTIRVKPALPQNGEPPEQ